jgi:hypothetical protein
MKDFLIYCLIVLACLQVVTMIYSIFHLMKSIFLFHSFISGLNPSIYKNGLFILGPFISFTKTLSSDEGWNSRNKAFKHLLLAIIALILTFAFRFIVDSIDVK